MTPSPAFAGRLAACVLAAVPAAAVSATLGLTRIDSASPVPAPIHLAAPPDDPSQLFVLSRSGAIHRYDRTTEAFDAVPFFSGPGDVASAGERGAYAIAFDRNFAGNGRLFLSYVDTGEVHRVVALDTTAPELADANPANDAAALSPVIGIPHPSDGSTNHYGGWIGVDTDNRLLITTGDSGRLLTSPLPPDTLLGKVLRIDATADAFPGDPQRNYAIPAENLSGTEVFANELRNPYRAGYDDQTETLLIADVGENRVEEVNIGLNNARYGWPAFEGSLEFRGDLLPGDPSEFDFPAFEYPHDTPPIDGRSITGGEVYRGPIPELEGQYFFGDFGSGGIYSLDFVPDAPTLDGVLPEDSLTVWDIEVDGVPALGIDALSSFGLDADGGLYVMGLGFGQAGGTREAGIFQITSVEGFGRVPLPASGWLLIGGLGALALRARRQRRKAPTSSRCGDQRNWSTGRTQSSA